MDDWELWFEMRNKQRNIIAILLIVAAGLFLLLNLFIYSPTDIATSDYDLMFILGFILLIVGYIFCWYLVLKTL